MTGRLEQSEAEKLATIYGGGGEFGGRIAKELRRLEARVQELEASQAPRAPLSDAAIDAAIWNLHHGQPSYRQVARAIEAAHGITQENQQ